MKILQIILILLIILTTADCVLAQQTPVRAKEKPVHLMPPKLVKLPNADAKNAIEIEDSIAGPFNVSFGFGMAHGTRFREVGLSSPTNRAPAQVREESILIADSRTINCVAKAGKVGSVCCNSESTARAADKPISNVGCCTLVKGGRQKAELG